MCLKTGRDPFARQDVTKRQVDGECDWCGGTNRRGKVYVYTVSPDGIQSQDHDVKGQFCSIGCLNSYHN